MLRFLATRLLQFPLILGAIYLITFLLAWVAPGSPFEGERNLPESTLISLRERYNADSPWRFLATYPIKMVQGDFGPSFKNEGWTVGKILGQRLPVSFQLGIAATLIATVVGVGLGVAGAVYRGRWLDWGSLLVALVGISVPSFVVAVGLLALFAFNLRWVPIGGWGEDWRQWILPSLALSLLPMAYVARLTRVSMIDVLGSDYVRTARAKGLSRPWVVFKHCLRNAILPVVSFLGPAAAAALTGSFVVEKIFNINGVGPLFVSSITDRDQPMILATVMIYSVLLLTLNLIVDVLYGVIDPRIEVA